MLRPVSSVRQSTGRALLYAPPLSPTVDRAAAAPPSAAPVRQGERIDFPSQFTIKERGFFRRTWFDLRAGSLRLGRVKERTALFRDRFDLKPPRGRRIARASSLNGFRDGFKLVDGRGQPMGMLRHRSPLGFSYELLDPNGTRVAVAKQRGVITPRYDFLREGDKQKVASLERSTFRSNLWKVTINDPAVVNPIVLVMLAAFETKRENQEMDQELEESEATEP